MALVTINGELYHYGVLGMKWGRRKNRKSGLKNGVVRQKTSVDTRSDDAKTAAKIKTKKVSEMSNQELRTINERTRLEQEYSRLNPNLVKKGTKIVAATAATMGTVMNLYNNSDKLVNLGKKLVDKYTKK